MVSRALYVHKNETVAPHCHDGKGAVAGHTHKPGLGGVHRVVTKQERTAYLGGPMRGIPSFNFPAFDAAAAALRAAKWTIHSPAEKDRDVLDISQCPTGSNEELEAQDFSLAGALTWDFARIAESGCVIFLPGWEKSTGCSWEATVAYALGKPVFLYPDLTPVKLPPVVTDPVQTQTEWTAWNRIHNLHPDYAEFAYEPSFPKLPVMDPDTTWPAGCEHDFGLSKPVIIPVPHGHSDGPGGEIRVIDPTTGGAKGQKATQMSALDPIALDYLGRVAGMGAEKYERYNYLKGYAWHLSYDAALRHMQAFWSGETLDPESGLPHTAHAAWQLLALTSFWHREIGTDDRPPRDDRPPEAFAA